MRPITNGRALHRTFQFTALCSPAQKPLKTQNPHISNFEKWERERRVGILQSARKAE